MQFENVLLDKNSLRIEYYLEDRKMRTNQCWKVLYKISKISGTMEINIEIWTKMRL